MRALLGVAGATLAPSTMSLIRNMFHDEHERQFAIGVWIASFSVGGGDRPAGRRRAAEFFWWGSVFLVAVPVMALLLLLGPALLPEYRDPNAGRLDPCERGAVAGAVLPTIYGLKQIAEHGRRPRGGRRASPGSRSAWCSCAARAASPTRCSICGCSASRASAPRSRPTRCRAWRCSASTSSSRSTCSWCSACRRCRPGWRPCRGRSASSSARCWRRSWRGAWPAMRVLVWGLVAAARRLRCCCCSPTRAWRLPR